MVCLLVTFQMCLKYFSLRCYMFVMNQVISHKAGTVFLKQNFHELRNVFLVKLECLSRDARTILFYHGTILL